MLDIVQFRAEIPGFTPHTDAPCIKSKNSQNTGTIIPFKLPPALMAFLAGGTRIAKVARGGVLFVSAALLAGAIAGATYLLHVRSDIKDTLENLTVIGALKATQIETWLAERKGDIDSLTASTDFAERVFNYQRTGEVRDRQLIENRLRALQRSFGYEDIQILDKAGVPLISLGKDHELPDETRELMASSILSGEMRRSDLVRDRAGRVHIDAVKPLRKEDGAVRAEAPVVLLHISPDKYLFPAIQSWPNASPSGETLLVRRDGDSVVYLNTLRHVVNSPLDMRLSISGHEKLPAAIGLISRQAGTVEGTDYRGMPVMAAYRPVKGTDWLVVAKMDRHEAMTESRSSAAAVGLVSFVGLLMLFTLIAKLVRMQRRADQDKLATESARAFRLFYDLPFIGMAITSPETLTWVRFNNRLCEILGYSRKELQQLSWVEMTHPEDIDKDMAEFNRIMHRESEGYVMDKRFIRKDGATVEATINVRCQRKPDGTVDFFVATVQDITERKAAEKAILRLSGMYRVLSQCNATIIRASREEELLEGICQNILESSTIRLCWISTVDAAGRVKPLASAGTGTEYLADIDISLDPADPHGRGPTATSIREDRAFWCQDFRNDPATAPWHERGAEFGWSASASLPIHRGGRVIGALTAYAGIQNAFDPQIQELMLEIARNLGFSLDNLDRETARRASEQALYESEEHYRLLVDSSPDAILLVSPERKVLSANPAAGKIFGCPPDKLVGLSRADLLDTADPRSDLVPEALQRTGEFRGELTSIRRNGEKFPTETSIVMLQYGLDKDRLSLIIRDITERKAAVEKILGQLDELRRWHAAMLDREGRVLELKREVNDLAKRAGLPPVYASVATGAGDDSRQENA